MTKTIRLTCLIDYYYIRLSLCVNIVCNEGHIIPRVLIHTPLYVYEFHVNVSFDTTTILVEILISNLRPKNIYFMILNG